MDLTSPPTVASGATPQLRLRGVHKAFRSRGRTRPVFAALDATLDLDRTHLVFGVNGGGKSTLLRLVAGLVTPDAGSIEVTGLPRAQDGGPRRLHGASTPAALTGRLTVRENVRWFASMGHYPFDPDRLQAIARPLGLDGRLDDFVESLSHGQQQKALLLRAFACRCPLLMLDEPTEALDDEAVAGVVALLAERSRAGEGTLVATHDRRLLAVPRARPWRVQDGTLVAQDLPGPAPAATAAPRPSAPPDPTTPLPGGDAPPPMPTPTPTSTSTSTSTSTTTSTSPPTRSPEPQP